MGVRHCSGYLVLKVGEAWMPRHSLATPTLHNHTFDPIPFAVVARQTAFHNIAAYFTVPACQARPSRTSFGRPRVLAIGWTAF